MAAQSDKDGLRQVKKHYDQQGYVIFRNVLNAELVSEARDHIDWLLEKNPGLRPELLDHYLMTDDPFWVRLVSDDRLLDIAEQFIGADIALFASHYIAKPPKDGREVLWHQDGTYWPLEPMEVVSLWLSIDGSDIDNGCMRVIPRTHNMRLFSQDELLENQDGKNVLGTGIDPSQIDESQAIDIVLKPGEVSVHHPSMIHGSKANTSSRWRRGLTIRYIPTTTRIITDEPYPSAFMLRGNAVKEINRYQPWPKFVEGRHKPFVGISEWNKRCEAANVADRRYLI